MIGYFSYIDAEWREEWKKKEDFVSHICGDDRKKFRDSKTSFEF